MDMTLVYFVYGLAFFCLGLIMLLEAGRAPLMVEAGVLRPLALFGLLHGAHEWIEMFLYQSPRLIFDNPLGVAWIRVALLTISFICLLIFGLLMRRPLKLFEEAGEQDSARKNQQLHRFWYPALLSWMALVFGLVFVPHINKSDYLMHLDATVRYAIAMPGAALAGVMLWRQSKYARRLGSAQLALPLQVAGGCFVLYALTQVVVPPIDIFPANRLNTQTFSAVLGFPVQMVRGGLAILITAGMLGVMQVVEAERQHRFIAAQHDRVMALEQAHQELLQREAMRQEWVRSIVMAQEDERARIARELHDETSQTLTAFSLHLAALAQEIGEVGKSQVGILQSLTRRMSIGLYRLVRDLRPVQLDDLGLAPALKELAADDQTRLGLKVNLQVHGERKRLEPAVETALYRVVQEALTNVARHAGVETVIVCLDFQPDTVLLKVTDMGAGFDPEAPRVQNGIGLAGIRERVQSLGGELSLRSVPGQGASIEVSIPHRIGANVDMEVG